MPTPTGSHFGGTRHTTCKFRRGIRHFQRLYLPATQAAHGPRSWAPTWPGGDRASRQVALCCRSSWRRPGSKELLPWASMRPPTVAGASGTARSKEKIDAFSNHKPNTFRLGLRARMSVLTQGSDKSVESATRIVGGQKRLHVAHRCTVRGQVDLG